MSEDVTEKDEGEARALKSRLARRLLVAAGLVAVLLGVLFTFDRLASPPEPDEEARVYTQPVPVGPKKMVPAQPVVPNDNLPPPPVAPDRGEVSAEASTGGGAAGASPDPAEGAPGRMPDKAIPGAAESPLPAPVVAAQPSTASPRSGAGAAKLAAAVPVPPRGGRGSPEPAATVISGAGGKPVPAPAPVEEEITASPPMAPASPVPPSARLVARTPSVDEPPARGARLFSGFSLQAGVFESSERAEELRARLAMSGVSAVLETRVQVGPFRTRGEAEAAQSRLKAAGIDTVLVPPKGARK